MGEQIVFPTEIVNLFFEDRSKKGVAIKMKVFNKMVDFVAECLGKIGWLIVLYAAFFGLTDVILRYVFNSPSLWISVTIQYTMVMLACLGGAYSLKYDAFVKLDLLYARLSERKKALSDIITFPIGFMYLYVLIWKGSQVAVLSFSTKEVTPTAIPIPLYHLKALIPFGAFCALLVLINKLIRDIYVIRYERK